MLKYTIIFLVVSLSPLSTYASEEFYTIQTGSLIRAENARRQFDSIAQTLDADLRNYLRIEKVKGFYTVRVGKFEEKASAKKVLRKIKSLYPGAIMLKAYIKDERIIRLYRRESPAEEEGSEGMPLAASGSPSKTLSSIDPETSHTRAKEMLQKGNYKAALSLLAPFISEPMEYPTIVSDYLVILVWDERYDDAIGMYENLPPSFPKRPYLLRNMAKAYYEKKQYLKALPLYRAVLEQTPSDEEARKGLVLSLIQRGDLVGASEYLERFLKETPESLSLARIRAYLLYRQGKYLESLRAYRLLAAREDTDSEHIYKVRDDLIASLSVEERQAVLSELFAASKENEKAMLDYLLVLILTRDYDAAVRAFEASGLSLEAYTDHLIGWIAWAYFKAGDTEKAKRYYEKILSSRPDYLRANIGLAYCLSVEGKGDMAIEILDRLLMVEPWNLEIRFARAFVYERSNEFWNAVREYDRILKVSPDNLTARKLRLRSLSDLGASSLALEEAYRDLPLDAELRDSIKEDMAVDRINWKEPVEAVSILLPLLEDMENRRARFDHIIALAENDDMQEVVKAYEDLIKDGISAPPWVLENVAKAYLYLEKPYKALELYNEALDVAPASFDGRMGKFYALQELRRWDEAKEVLDSLDREQPELLRQGRLVRPNWPKLEISVARGWFIAYEGRMSDAEGHFWSLRERAPADMGIRSGLAHVYLWRGWPRKALREFKIIKSIEPKYVKAKIGMTATLNELAFKEQAREDAGKLLKTYPKNKHVQQLVRQLEVEEMRELVTDFVVTKDEDGFKDIRAEITLTQPVSLYTDFYGFLLWQESSYNNQTRFYRRIGLGANHVFNSSWSIRQQFSVDYDNRDDFGSFTLVNFNPDDYWSFALSYDSFTTDVPLRARVYEIEADKLEAGIAYRESEWRSYRLSLSRLKFSDGNDRRQARLGYEQGLWVKNNWKMRLFLDLYTSRNSREDAPYFNPDHDLSLSATHMTEYTHWRIYNRAFVQKLFLTLGTYRQSGFPNGVIWSIRYQQDHDFSDTQALLWGLTLARQVYDGEPVHNYSFYLTYRGRF